MSELIPPNYGIVDGDAFYVTAVVAGRAPVAGERVLCEAVPNTDGGRYAWRCLSVQLAPPEAPPKPAPAPMPPAVRACQGARQRACMDMPAAAALLQNCCAEQQDTMYCLLWRFIGAALGRGQRTGASGN